MYDVPMFFYFILSHIKKERGKELIPIFKAGMVKDLVPFLKELSKHCNSISS